MACPNCGQTILPGTRSCESCGRPLFASTPQPEPVVELAGEVLELATFWRRAGASAIDTVLVGAVYYAIAIAMLVASAGAAEDDQEEFARFFVEASGWMIAVTLGVGIALQWMWNSIGWSPGKLAVGIRIVRADGYRPGPVHGLARSGMSFVSGWLLGLGFFWAAWSRARQTWHDKAAQTYVVRAGSGFAYPATKASADDASARRRSRLATGGRGWVMAGFGLLIVVGYGACSAAFATIDYDLQFPGEFRALYPLPSEGELEGAVHAPPADDCSGEGPRVCLVAIGPPSEISLHTLTSYYRTEPDLQVVTMPTLTLNDLGVEPESLLDREREQLDGTRVLAALERALPSVANDPDVTLIAVTHYDLFMSADPALRWVFGTRRTDGLAIVSDARMDDEAWGYLPYDHLRQARLIKMTSKYIGVIHFGLAESSDPYSPVYCCIGSLDDLDWMDLGFQLVPGAQTNRHTWRGSGSGSTGMFEVGSGNWDYCGSIVATSKPSTGVRFSLYTEAGLWVSSDSGKGGPGSVGCTPIPEGSGPFEIRVFALDEVGWSVSARPRGTEQVGLELPYWDSAPTAISPVAVDAQGVRFRSDHSEVTDLFLVPSTAWTLCYEFTPSPADTLVVQSPYFTISVLLEDEPGQVGLHRLDPDSLVASASGCIEVKVPQPSRYRLLITDGVPGTAWTVLIVGAS